MAIVLDCSATMAWTFSNEPSVAADGPRESLIDETCC